MNILVVRSGGLGDALVTMPVIALIKRLQPEATVHVLGNGAVTAVARLSGFADEYSSIDLPPFARLLHGDASDEFLRGFCQRFDRAYIFSAGNPEPVRRAMTAAGIGDCHALDPRPPDGFDGHITEHLAAILNGEVIGSGARGLPRDYGFTAPRAGDGDVLVIHPGSGGAAKNWPLSRFLYIAGEYAPPVRFIAGPAECERGFVGELTRTGWPVTVPASVADLARLLAGARIFLGNDSGVSHLAAAVGTPTVVLFGPTDPQRWRPLGGTVRVVRSPDGSMAGITADAVKDTLASLGL